jgi:putative ABC transport system permease protein
MTGAGLLWAYLRARPLAVALTVLLVALGIATTTIVTLVTNQLQARLVRDAAGIDLVVGAKGSPLQLVLAGVHHVDVPPGNVPFASLAELRANRLVAQAIPVSLGDSFRGFRIVGTEPALLERYGARFSAGAAWREPMQAVLGARVAAEARLGVGSTFIGTHGLTAGGSEHGDDPYTVVGVLAPTGGVVDRLVLTSLESVWRAHEGEPADEAERRVLEAEREITLMLVRYASPLAAATLPRAIDASPRLQAASPAFESARLFRLLGFGIEGLRAFGVLLLAVAALSVFVAQFQALSDRRRELALMRLLGASPGRLATMLVAEAMLVTAIGVALGLGLGHAAVEVAGRLAGTNGDGVLTGFDFDTIELVYAAGALGLGIVAAAVPARRAASTPLAGVLVDE